LFGFFLLLSSQLFAQKTITGRITSGETPLSNVTVQIKGSATGTQTDETGNFSINAPASATLVISSVGFNTQEIRIGTRSAITIQMQSSDTQLEQVVVVGYGTQKKATLTGSVSTVKGADVIKSPTLNVSNSLAGRLPGLTAVNAGGEPGYDGSRLLIRGTNTFGNASPLIVVDGVPGRSLERIDPSTIESISVLKDASAAIYGAQAANGVILVTTKRGKTGKPTVTLSFNQGYGRPTRIPEMANAVEYATLLNEIDQYAGNAARFKPEDIQKFSNGSDPWTHPNTDWFKAVLRPWSGQNFGNLSVSGGSDNMKYFVSLSSRSQEGYYYNSGTKYNQYDFRSNLDGNINKYVSLSVDLSGRMEDRNFPSRSAGSIFRMVMRGKPNLPAYWPNGMPGPDIEYGDNPVVVSTKATGYNRDKRYVVNTNFKVNVKIPWVDGLSFTGNAAIDKNIVFNKNWQTPWYLYSWDGRTRNANNEPVLVRGKKGFDDPRLTQSVEDNHNILLNGLINYEKSIAEDHSVKLLVGAEKITGRGDNFNAFRRNFISTTVDQLFAGAVNEFTSNNGSAYSSARQNYFGRVNYAFRSKYLAEFVWRYQGSYIFEKSSRFGFFPGVSLGYVLSEEQFFKKSLPSVDYFKLRGSWGQTGNDLIDPYKFLSTYGLGSLAFVSGTGTTLNPVLFESGVPNVSTTWEKAIQRNIGIDLQLLNNRLSVTADYFNNLRSDILWKRNASVPVSAGINTPPENIGKSGNKGFDFGITYNNIINSLNYQIGINGGYAKNKIIFWDETAGAPLYQQSTGYPIGSGLLYNAIGIFKDEGSVAKYPHWPGAKAGDIIFEDVNNDTKIDANDRVRNTRNDVPRWTGGFTLGLQFKGFDLATLVQGASGAIRYISTESGEIGNYLRSFYNDRWTPQNPDATGPRTFNRSNEYYVGQANTYWLHKTDYVRLKNIEFGYTLPVSLSNRLGIQSIRAYVNGFNLLTFSPDMKDFDPELGSNSGQSYPLQKIVNGGVSVTF